ncbi:MAG: calcium/sodium antiporter [Anaerolineales bacterium]
MLQDTLFLLVGFAGLLFGAEQLVKGAARLADRLGISALVIGLTVVAFGTSMPEQVISLIAALNDSSDIAVGNVIGSNFFNIALILGVAGVIFPIAIDSQLVRRDLPILIGVSLIAYLFAFTGERISRPEGGILFAGVLAFTWLSYRLAGDEPEAVQQEGVAAEADRLAAQTPAWQEVVRLVVGVVILVIGANLAVEGATGLARAAGVSERVIGLTLVAAGTSLPELATSVMAALRKAPDIAIGNVIGSNIFNLTSILGLTALVQPIPVSADFLRLDFPIMLAITILLVPLFMDRKLQRAEAGLCLALFAGYMGFLFAR